MKIRILYQGDSVTDAGRHRSDPSSLGGGYPLYASENIRAAFPDVEFEFFNRGIGGNRTSHLLDRLQCDLIDIQPDIVSVLIGVNDVWHRYNANEGFVQTSDEQVEANYREILTQIREKTHAKILMLEPYQLASRREDVPIWRNELDRVIRIERKLASEFADAYLSLDGLLASAEIADGKFTYSDDGVHPNRNGSVYIGKLYADSVTPLIQKVIDEKNAAN